jgi:hypothetical protein
MAEKDPVQELSVLFPASYELSLGGENITLRPFKAGALPKLIPAMARMANVFMGIDWQKVTFGATETKDEHGNVGVKFKISPETFEVIATICEEGGETFKEIIALAVGKTAEWFDELDLAEGIELAGMVILANQDFFEKRLMEVLNRLVKAKGEQDASRGPKPSKS